MRKQARKITKMLFDRGWWVPRPLQWLGAVTVYKTSGFMVVGGKTHPLPGRCWSITKHLGALALLSVVLALPLAGCGSVAKQYVEADRKTYDAIAPEYLKYVDADGTLSDDDKKLRHATADSWGYRLEQAEKAGK